MRVLIAPNAFKESLSAPEVADALARGMAEVRPDFEMKTIPLADGGDGTLEALTSFWGGRVEEIETEDPLRRPIRALVGLSNDGATGIVEMARISGLALLTDREKDPTRTTTTGLGIALKTLAARGVEKVYLGIGGSATNDGGVGMGETLGFRHVDKAGRPVDPVGGRICEIHQILPPAEKDRVGPLDVSVFCDVSNPLCGDRGASRVYGPQKGATPERIEQLEEGLAHLAKLWRRDLGRDVEKVPGSGAAGGVGGGAMVYLDANLVPGADTLIEMTRLREEIVRADLVITGEGAFDLSTLEGKLPGRVARLAKAAGVPCVGVCGLLEFGMEDRLKESGFTRVLTLAPDDLPLTEKMARAREFAVETGRRLAALET